MTVKGIERIVLALGLLVGAQSYAASPSLTIVLDEPKEDLDLS